MSKKSEHSQFQGPKVPQQDDQIDFTPIDESGNDRPKSKKNETKTKHLGRVKTHLKAGHRKIKSFFSTKAGIATVCVMIIAAFSVTVPYSIDLLSSKPPQTAQDDANQEQLITEKTEETDLKSPDELTLQKPVIDETSRLEDDFAAFGAADLFSIDAPPMETEPDVSYGEQADIGADLAEADLLAGLEETEDTEPGYDQKSQNMENFVSDDSQFGAYEPGIPESDKPSIAANFNAAPVAVAAISASHLNSGQARTTTVPLTEKQDSSKQSNANRLRPADNHLPMTVRAIDEDEEGEENFVAPIEGNRLVLESRNPVRANPVRAASDVTSSTSQQASYTTSEPAPKYTAAKRTEYQPRHAKIQHGSPSLPNTHGQIWCEYDISPYTKSDEVATTAEPQQVIVDWIIDHTGAKAWHGEPLGILSANADKLYVYHTPKMQQEVAKIVDRFVNPHVNDDAYTFRVISLNNPSWLAKGHEFMTPITINTAGVQGWLMEKEYYTRLISDISSKPEYKELGSSQLMIGNGRQHLVNASIPRKYTRNVLPDPKTWPGYTTEMSVIHEGYKICMTPLSGIDGETAELLIKCDMSQVEKMYPVILSVPSPTGARQRVTVESPQVAQFHLDEKIDWPKGKVLLLDFGTVPIPGAAKYNDNGKLIPDISRKLAGNSTVRGNILLIVECKTR